MKKILFFIAVAALVTLYFSPAPLLAGPDQDFKPAGLVPASCAYSFCSSCDFLVLIQDILNFLWFDISIPVAALMFAWGGFIMIVPGVGGEKSAASFEKGKKILTNTVIGLVIVFMGWLLIDTIIKVIAGQNLTGGAANINGYGPWNKIECSAPQSTSFPSGTPAQQPQGIDIKAQQQKDLQAIFGKPGVPKEEIVNQTKSILAKYPGAFDANDSAQDSCKGFTADGTMRAVAGGNPPPVCSTSCSCIPGGPSGNITLSSQVLALTDRVLSGLGNKAQVVSLTTGVHSSNDSLHYQGKAVDFVPRNGLTVQQLYAYIQTRAGPGSQVIFEGNHVHVQYR